MNRPWKKIIITLLALCQLLLFPAAAAATESIPETTSDSKVNIPRAVFGNDPVEDVYLDVTKTVTADEGVVLPDNWQEQEFSFTLRQGDQPAGNVSFVYVVDGKEVTPGSQTNANGHFTLKHGQTVRFKAITHGAQYTVTENQDSGSNYSLKRPSGTSGYTDVLDEAVRWEFVNEYVPTPPPDSHTLRVRKNVSVPDGFTYDGDEDFTFQLSLGAKSSAGLAYSVWDSVGLFVRDSLTDDDGYFTLKAGQTAQFEIAEAEDYAVAEILSQAQRDAGWRIIGEDSYEGALSASPTLDFTNTLADLVVHKVLSDNSTSDDIFTFQLIDINQRALAGRRYYLYDRSHQLMEITWGTDRTQPLKTDESGSFTLKAGQYAVFVDIPENYSVKVSERHLDGYNLVVTEANSSYHTITGNAVTLEYKNTPVKRSGLYVTKVVQDVLPNEISPRTDLFTFTLLRKNASGEYVPYKANYTIGEGTSAIGLSTTDDGKFSIKKAETAKFTYLPLGDYKIVEDSLDGREEYVSLEGDGVEGQVAEGVVWNVDYRNQYKPQMMDLKIKKTDSESSKILLPGAVFSIYTNEELTKFLRDSEESETEKGVYTITDLKPGIYYLTESKAPLGYYRMPDPVKIEIALEYYTENDEEKSRLNAYVYNANGERVLITEAENKDLFSALITPEAGVGADGFPLNDDLCMTISNESGHVLPDSGGYLPLVYALAVVAIVGGFAAATVRILRRRAA